MIKNKGLFSEEEIFGEPKRLGKPLPNLHDREFMKLFEVKRSLNNKIDNNKKKVSQKQKQESKPRNNNKINSDSGSDSLIIPSKQTPYNNLELVIKVTEIKYAPISHLRQFEQLYYFSRIEKKLKGGECYLKNKDTFLYDHNDNKINSKEAISEIAHKWAYDKNRQGEEAISRQMIISTGGKENKDKVLALTRQFLKEVFGSKGFEYCYAPHYDTKNDHIHVIIKKRSKLNKNLTLYKKDLKQIRKKYHSYLLNAGIKRSINSRIQNKKVLSKISQRQEHIKNNNSWYQSKLNKGNDKDYNAYRHKATINGNLQSQIDLIKIKLLLYSMDIKDNNLINAIKPLLRIKGFKKIHQSLSAVNEAKGHIKNMNGFILKAIKDEYQAKILINIPKKIIDDLKKIKKEILNKENKEEVINLLNDSVKSLKLKDKKLAQDIEAIFKNPNVRYSYVKQKKEIDLSIKKEELHYIPDLTDYEIQERFIDYIQSTSIMDTTNLEIAVSKAFANPHSKVRFGKDKENELLWRGEVGWFKSYQTAEYDTWSTGNIKDKSIKYKAISSQELKERKAKKQEEVKINQEQESKKYEAIATECVKEFSNISFKGDSKYLKNKGVDDIDIQGIGYNQNHLVIPISDVNNKIWSLQYIYDNSFKNIKKDSKKLGNFFTLTKNKDQQLENNDKPLFIAEGFATALTIYRATDYQDTLFAINASNMNNVTRSIKEKYPDKKIIIVSDNDIKQALLKGNNPGIDKAKEIKEEFPDVKIIYPEFDKEEAKRKIEKINKLNSGKKKEDQQKIELDSDFNDLEKNQGKEFVKEEISMQLKGLGVRLRVDNSGLKGYNYI